MTRSLRETLGSDYAASRLEWDAAGAETAIDRLVASAWTGQRLGQILTRLKYANERTTFNLRAAMWMIVDRTVGSRAIFGKRKPTPALIAHCAAALDEWLNDLCPDCTAGWRRLETTPKRCPTCNGVARIAWTDEQRTDKLGGLYDPRQYERILRRLQEADAQHDNQTRRGLRP